MRKVWTDADTALLERVCATGKMDDGSLATDGKLARALECCRRTIIRQRQVRQLVALASPKEGGQSSALRRQLGRHRQCTDSSVQGLEYLETPMISGSANE